jgi:hypothetical protein
VKIKYISIELVEILIMMRLILIQMEHNAKNYGEDLPTDINKLGDRINALRRK